MKTLKQLSMKKKYRDLKESIRMVNNHRSYAEKVIKIGINEAIKRNEIINNNLKYR